MPPELENRQTIAIIGAGPLGRWLALAAARAGYRVLLEDVMPTNLHHAQEYIRRQLGPRYFADRSLAASGASLKGAFHGEVTALTDEMDLKDTPAFIEDTGFLEGANSSPVCQRNRGFAGCGEQSTNGHLLLHHRRRCAPSRPGDRLRARRTRVEA